MINDERKSTEREIEKDVIPLKTDSILIGLERLLNQ